MATVPRDPGSAYIGPKVTTAPLGYSPQAPRDTSNVFGAAEGRALSNVGKQVSAVGDRLGQVVTQLQVEENEFQVKKADVALSEGYRLLLNGDGTPENPGYTSLTGEAAAQALPALNARLAEVRKNVTENIQGERAKEMFSLYSAPKEQTAIGTAATHSIQQAEVAKDAVSIARVENAVKDAAAANADLKLLAGIAANESRTLAAKKTQDPETLALAARAGSSEVYKAAIKAAIGRRDVPEATRMLKVYGEQMDPQTAANSQEAIALAIEQGRVRRDQQLSREREARSLGMINEAVDLRVAAARGQDVTQEALDFRQRYAQDKQGALQFLAIMNAGNAEQQRIAKEQAKLLRGAAAVNGEIVLDPYNSEDKDVADTTYAKMAEQWQAQGASSQQQMESTITFVNQTGVVPEQVKQAVRGGLNSLNPDTVLSAAGILEQITAANPIHAQQFSANQISVGVDVLDYVRSGATPAEAVQLSKEARQVPEAQKTARSAEFTALVKDQPPAEYLEEQYPGGWFSSAPAASSTMRTEFENLAKQEYIRTGKLDSSYAAAGIMLAKTWGVSAISGSAGLMKHPPEKVYGVPGLPPEANSAWMREQLVSDFTANAMYPPGAEQALIATPHPNARETDGKMKYAVIFRNPESGELVTVMDPSGVEPLAWRPDYSTSPAKVRDEEAKRAALEAAHVLRQQQSPEAKEATGKALNSLIVGGP